MLVLQGNDATLICIATSESHEKKNHSVYRLGFGSISPDQIVVWCQYKCTDLRSSWPDIAAPSVHKSEQLVV